MKKIKLIQQKQTVQKRNGKNTQNNNNNIGSNSNSNSNNSNNNKSSPKSFGKSASLPHVGECTLSLCVLAVACIMRNKALQKRYGGVTKSYGSAAHHWSWL